MASSNVRVDLVSLSESKSFILEGSQGICLGENDFCLNQDFYKILVGWGWGRLIVVVVFTLFFATSPDR